MDKKEPVCHPRSLTLEIMANSDADAAAKVQAVITLLSGDEIKPTWLHRIYERNAAVEQAPAELLLPHQLAAVELLEGCGFHLRKTFMSEKGPVPNYYAGSVGGSDLEIALTPSIVQYRYSRGPALEIAYGDLTIEMLTSLVSHI